MNRSGGHYVLEGPIIIRGGWCLKIVEPITIRLLVKIDNCVFYKKREMKSFSNIFKNTNFLLWQLLNVKNTLHLNCKVVQISE